METLTYGTVETPWGRLSLEIGPYGLQQVSFDEPVYPPLTGLWADVMAAYLAKRPIPLDLPVDLSTVPPFSRRVLERCRQIPAGSTMTYGELAHAVGHPNAARAIGQAMANNPVPVVIPCHRVVGAGNRLIGFGGGLAWKAALLAHERSAGWQSR